MYFSMLQSLSWTILVFFNENLKMFILWVISVKFLDQWSIGHFWSFSFSLFSIFSTRSYWPRRSNFLTIVCHENTLLLYIYISSPRVKQQQQCKSQILSLCFFSYFFIQDQVDTIATHWSIVGQTIKMKKELRVFFFLKSTRL